MLIHYNACTNARLTALIRSDNGPQFVSGATQEWIAQARHLHRAQWSGQNCTDESFNGMFCGECRSIEGIRSRREAAVFIESSHQQPAVGQ